MAGFMIAAELAQLRLVQLKQDFAQLFGGGITGGKTLSVNLAQGADEGVAVLVADFAVMVAVAIFDTCITHCFFSLASNPLCRSLYSQGLQHPPAGSKGQPMTLGSRPI